MNERPAFSEAAGLPSNSRPGGTEALSSGVSWGAVIAGAFVCAALYLILLALGAGFGLSAVSPWSNPRVSAAAVGGVAIAWLIFIEIVSSALGGYLTGRLRTKWTLIHGDEVFFRDTANGFLSWAVSVVAGAILLGSAAAYMAGSVVSPVSFENTSASLNAGNTGYFVDRLFRSDRAAVPGDDVLARAEVERILTPDLARAEIDPADRSFLADLVAARTGISRADADKRISDITAEVRRREDAARKATARLLLWLFVSLLAGAFTASIAATIGGRQRDHMKAVP